MRCWKSRLFNTPLRIIIALGFAVFTVELLLMALLHDVIIPVTHFKLSNNFWSFIDAATLTLLVIPALYFLVFKRMQHDLAEFAQLATNLTDSLLIGVLLVDKDLRVHRWNQWLEHKTGIAAKQACGRCLTELFADFNSPRLLSAVEMCIDRKSPQVISQALNQYVLPIPVPFAVYGMTMMRQQVSVVPLTDGCDKTLAVVSINDVTEGVAKSTVLARLAKKLELQSNRDQLTGAYNRHFLWTWLTPELRQCARYGQQLCCLMLDIDHFKHINDTHGHDIGDAVLRGFASILDGQLRDSDILVRYGGEEFVVFLTHADASVALEIANRILNAMRLAIIAPLPAGGVRCSIGVSNWTKDYPCSAEELLKEADECLYQAKHNGRDRVVMGCARAE